MWVLWLQVVAGALLGTVLALGWWQYFYSWALPFTDRFVATLGDRGMAVLAFLLLIYMLISLGPLEARYNTRFAPAHVANEAATKAWRAS